MIFSVYTARYFGENLLQFLVKFLTGGAYNIKMKSFAFSSV